MSTTSQDSSLAVQTPTLIPSICFFISFTLLSILHLVKFIRVKRTIYLYLLVFSLLRTCLFIFRIAWSPNPDSMTLGIISSVLLLGGFFVILEALCILMSDWLLLLIEGRTFSSLPCYERHSITSLKFVAPIFSIIGAAGEIFGQQNAKSIFRQTSSLGFLCLIIIYILVVAYFALKYGDVAIRKQLKALVLFISAALLLIELVYRTFISFSHETSPIYYYEWVFYVFECVPEIVLLLILGEVILGEWFYSIEDDNKLKIARQLAKLQSFGASVRDRNQEKEEEANSQTDSKTIPNIIIINVNDEDNKLLRTNTTNTTNTNISSAADSTNSYV